MKIQEKKAEVITFRKNFKGNYRGFDTKKIRNKINTSNEQSHYKSLQYLGFEFNGQNIYIRPGSLSKYFRKAKGRILKSVKMAYGSNSKAGKILKKKIYDRYTHFGERNFITYAQNAAKISYTNSSGVIRDGLNSPSIRRQLSAHFTIIEREIKKKSAHFSSLKNIIKKE
ncbi:MAG: hypothetical protein EOO47_24495 [Flavobacterium sp.]|nr:MAG: hypothetical protein EOO47_24495 [Flavobacterium sp.]